MILFSVVFALAGQAATVGTVIPIIGEPKGMAYDAARKLLFISNSTQNRVEVFSTEQMQLLTPITVGVKPGALELVPDSTLLLVCNTESTSLSVIDREALAATGTIPVTARSVQTPERPFSVAALSNGTALLSTNVGLQRIDLVARTTQPITNAGFAVPANVNLVSSGNHKFVLGQGGTVAFLYTDQGFAQVRAAAGSSLLAADAGGTRFLVGPTQFDNTLFQTAQLFPDGPNSQIPTLSGVAFSASGSQAYFGVNQESGAQIQVRDTAALRRISAFLIPEQILGGLLATSDGSYLFALTQSGLTVVNLAEAAAAPALSVSTDVLYFSAQICALEPVSRTVEITNSGSGVFTWSASTPLSNVTIEPASGTGPATLTITVDPSKLNFRGSALMGSVQIASEESVSGTQTVFLVLNIRGPDQRGVVYPVKGTFSDLLLDEARQRIYVVNTSESRIEIFSLTQQQYQAPAAVASMPKSIAFLPDRSRLLVAHYGSEYLSVLDAETLNLITRIPIPHPNNPTERPGTLPFSIAPAGGGIFLVAAAPAPPATTGTIYRVDAGSSTATAFPFLGSANNATSSATYLAASGNGAFILAAQAGGTIHLYDTATGNFAITRSLGTAISGNVAASSDGLWYFAGTQVLNSVLVQQGTIPSTITGAYTEVGFAFGLNGPEGYRSIRPSGQLPGLPSVLPPRIEKVKTDTLAVLSEFNIAESVTAGSSQLAYRVIRSMAVNPAETTLYALGVWGLMVIPLPGQSSGLQPRISPGGIVNGASFALDPAPVSPGSIASIFGTQLSTGTANASSLPLPKVLGGVCVTMEGFVAPLFAATPTQLNVQVPWELAGRATARAIVSAEGTASPPATVNLSTAAPGIFTFSSDGMGAGAILHADFSPVSIANPARIGETVSIFATGLGTVSPLIASGVGAPTDGTQHRTTATPVVTIGGVNATVSFSGLAPGFVGLYQVNVRIPSNAPVGTNIPVSIRVGANISNQATMAIVPAAP